MELFSEIYSCYYQVLRHLLCSRDALSIQDIRSRICGEGFEESLLSIIPKLEDGTWNLFEREGKLYLSRISSAFITPVSGLEKAYLKALLSDPRIGLFLDNMQSDALDRMHLLNQSYPLSMLYQNSKAQQQIAKTTKRFQQYQRSRLSKQSNIVSDEVEKREAYLPHQVNFCFSKHLDCQTVKPISYLSAL